MMKINYILKIIIIMLILGDCREIYYPKDLDSSEKILIVEGRLNKGSEGAFVKLAYAASILSDDYATPVCCATVIISDDIGTSITLENISLGNYYSKPGELTGVPGRKYKLYIELIDGSTYESQEETMPHQFSDIEITAIPGFKREITQNLYGDIIVKEHEGLDLVFNSADNHVEKKFARINSSVVSQTIITINVSDIYELPLYCWEKYYNDDLIYVERSLYDGNMQVIKSKKFGFLYYVYDLSMRTDTSTPPLPSGWIVSSNIYSINESAYEYYKTINEQLEASNSIFDPIPVQLTGNIRCTSDSNAYVTGIFEVVSDTIINKAFRWSPGYLAPNDSILDQYIAPDTSGCMESIRPPFWVNIN